MHIIGYLRTKTSSQIDHSPWGMQYLPGEYPHDLMLESMGNSGVKWARLLVQWPSVEVGRGRYDWGPVDKLVDGLISRGINVFMGTICSSYPEREEFPSSNYYYPPTDSPEELEGYCRYAEAMVERYRDRVRHYEIWNEPNVPDFWIPEPDANAYALLVRQVSEAIRSVDSGVKVMGGALSQVGLEVTQYARDFLSQPGTAEAIDILTYHPYMIYGQPLASAPEVTLEEIVTLRETGRELHPGLPIWQTECGCPSSADTIHVRGDTPWGYNIQAKWLLRRLLTDYMAGAKVSTYYLLMEFDDPRWGPGYNTKGLVQHTTWQTKPAYYALQNLTAVIDSSWKLSNEKATAEVVDPGIFYGIGPHEERFPCVFWHITMRREGVPLLCTGCHGGRRRSSGQPMCGSSGLRHPGTSQSVSICSVVRYRRLR